MLLQELSESTTPHIKKKRASSWATLQVSYLLLLMVTHGDFCGSVLWPPFVCSHTYHLATTRLNPGTHHRLLPPVKYRIARAEGVTWDRWPCSWPEGDVMHSRRDAMFLGDALFRRYASFYGASPFHRWSCCAVNKILKVALNHTHHEGNHYCQEQAVPSL